MTVNKGNAVTLEVCITDNINSVFFTQYCGLTDGGLLFARIR